MTPLDERPFRILGLQQVAIGALDKGRLRSLWVDLLGCQPISAYRSDAENVDEDIISIGDGDTRVEIDLMQPIDPTRSPAVHRPPLNHIGLWVDHLDAAVAWLAERGVRFASGGIRTGASGYSVCFIHPRPSTECPVSGEGVLIELVQADPARVAALADTHGSLSTRG